MKIVAVGFTVFVVALVAFVMWSAWSSTTVLEIGNFIVLALTLIVLVWYAYDTNSIARLTHERWQREGVLGTTYSMELVNEPKESRRGRTLFRIQNASPLVVRARVTCTFRVYGEQISADPLYDGKEAWLVFPQQTSQGWFDIDTLLQKKGKSVAGMIAEFSETNRKQQFTMLLNLDFSDELGEERRLPPRFHYFDFDRWVWIPRLAEGEGPL